VWSRRAVNFEKGFVILYVIVLGLGEGGGFLAQKFNRITKVQMPQ
jgi:hypothetical protein